MPEEDRHRVIVGVDFGTTYTGVSFVSSQSPEVVDIRVIDSWPGKNGQVDNRTLEKVPTEISYASDGSPNEWGYQLAAGASRYGCFKLMLDGSLPGIVTRRDPRAGKTVVDISADYLKFVYEHTLSKLGEIMPTTLSATPIQFVLTTPAVWSHKAQSATLDAAKQAGFGSRSIDEISMVSEPEAAATYALQDMHAQFAGSEIFKAGEQIVICDCGGGTVDLITYKVLEVHPVLKLCEAVVGDGGKYGSTSIDRQFISMLRERIGEKMFKKLGPKKTGRGGSIMQAFESAKRGFTLGDTKQSWFIPIGNVPDNEIQQIEDGDMLLEYDDMETLFENSVQNIIKLLRNQVIKAETVSTILLVGGFGQSGYLFQSIKNWAGKTFPQMNIKVERPRNAWSAISRGACLHGVGGVVKSRKLKQHYGLRIGTSFIEGYHKEEDAWFSDWTGKKHTSNNIDWYASKGESVSDGQQLTIDCRHTRYDSPHKQVTYTIYSCNSEKATDDMRAPIVYKLGSYTAYLTDLPASAWETKITGVGTLYRATFNTVMEIGSADIIFKVVYQGKVYGSARMPYVSMGEGLRDCT
ncbi:actin-like ATPase domain-containing protein [Ascobolus immersus RN42]|uniref:Actin-like ATPase domain-containing protein n=1 Tax=Ascobolus immersus RN42 TaxID=1160509 RepID=A0A3N4HWG5_ASCIM|nr:actin-like ATPase domain-containing protein [Ascobolus immersus RN42]